MAFDDDDPCLAAEIAEGPVCGVGDDATAIATHIRQRRDAAIMVEDGMGSSQDSPL